MRYKLKKKHLLLVLSAMLIGAAAFTLAYFISSDQVTNRFSGENETSSSGKVEISISEEFDPPPDKSDDPFQKSVCVANTGETDCYIRVRLSFSSSQVRDISWISNDEDKDNADAYINAADYPYSDLPEGWEYREEDGFYYYTEKVPPGQSTATLIKWVKTIFPEDGSVEADEYDIYVYSESVTAVNDDGEELDYEQAWG